VVESSRPGILSRELTMHAIPVPHFEDLMLTSGRTADELERELRLLLAIKLFEMKRVSVGRAAEIAGMAKIAFLDELGRAGVPVINFGEDQLEQELRDV
jgi:predicted HTH domain antitoxin